MRIYFTVLAGVLGLAFGSFLNVCLSRWPAGESVAKPRSHCRACGRTLTWWENVPLLSWLALRGRCRTCGVWIGWRYPIVELAVGALWAYDVWRFAFALPKLGLSIWGFNFLVVCFLGPFSLLWLLVALAVLDAEHLWLPDKLTLPSILPGVFVAAIYSYFFAGSIVTPVSFANFFLSPSMQSFWLERFFSILLSAGLVLLIRWLYQLVRHREGIGLGDAKLMAMLGAWLGLEGALLAFALGILMGAVVGLVVLARGARAGTKNPALAKLPLGTFLCIGGIVSSLWGQPILAAYMRWAGFN
ncbi:MAG TPA: prepilin peptidase [Terracidiphilus sp.]